MAFARRVVSALKNANDMPKAKQSSNEGATKKASKGATGAKAKPMRPATKKKKQQKSKKGAAKSEKRSKKKQKRRQAKAKKKSAQKAQENERDIVRVLVHPKAHSKAEKQADEQISAEKAPKEGTSNEKKPLAPLPLPIIRASDLRAKAEEEALHGMKDAVEGTGAVGDHVAVGMVPCVTGRA